MGYSCTAKAAAVLAAIIGKPGGPRGVFEMEDGTWEVNGRKYFFECGEEQSDGAIVGDVMRVEGHGGALCVPVGKVRIEPSGDVTQFPTLHWTLRDVVRRTAMSQLGESL